MRLAVVERRIGESHRFGISDASDDSAVHVERQTEIINNAADFAVYNSRRLPPIRCVADAAFRLENRRYRKVVFNRAVKLHLVVRAVKTHDRFPVHCIRDEFRLTIRVCLRRVVKFAGSVRPSGN